MECRNVPRPFPPPPCEGSGSETMRLHDLFKLHDGRGSSSLLVISVCLRPRLKCDGVIDIPPYFL